jgi:hypothetical protein
MGRGLPAESNDNSFKHLEVYSFAQPGTSYTYASKAAIPAIVFRVPENAAYNAKYFAGFSVSDDFAATGAKFYTSVLQVTVVSARRYLTAALWEATLLQPDFQANTVLSQSDTPLTTKDATTTWVTAANANWGTVTNAVPG